MQTIAILSDFGTADAFVGTMKSVMCGIAPDARFIDLCHEIEPQNVLSGGYMLGTCARFLSTGTVVLGVVDPGVGTDRRAIAVDCDGIWLVGPDNGLFSMVYEQREPTVAYALTNPEFALHPISKTFHGRDVFAPAAAHLANGVDPKLFGPEIPVTDLARFAEIGPLIKDNSVECRVVHVDHFGNISTNLSKDVLFAAGKRPTQLEIRGVVAPFKETFGDVNYGEAVCYYSSTGFLEIGIRNGNAGDILKVRQRDSLHVGIEPVQL